MAKKGAIVKVRLLSTGKNVKGNPTGFTYYIQKNPKNITEKMSFRKYDPRAINPENGKLGCHVIFEEKKMPPHKK
ncbi:MAG: 50S ribosomal protein L33 [Alphaproteobacteria bacterium]|nr:50S ribosomal protein L33 [Alphaproteobacteria bacterium]MCB1552115.1 50S ribosomal protein L33 [Alphaproteobacteria bacterium]MCB9985230.1 50S ribosomal protein L33 [Micavibrio sp.]HPQ50589.1 50S ribosomal protein L33 [Alphaproteobacteria bacterium]HRK98689.1 50S ribosomal protein L33 [Alphaproteobacteria bacterium]